MTPRRGGTPARGPRGRRTAASRGRHGTRRGAALLALLGGALAGGCADVGEPVRDRARVAWAAYPETVLVGEVFSFEVAGPVAPNTCGHLDSVSVAVDSAVRVSARRRLYPDALCGDTRVSYYEVRPLRLQRPGRYAVRTEEGRGLGALVAVDSGSFSPVQTVGEGTVRVGGGCLFFGPGWANNQRPFALHAAPEELRRAAGTDIVVWVHGRLAGFSLCGAYGSRPAIRVREARVTGRTGDDWYPDGPPRRGGGP